MAGITRLQRTSKISGPPHKLPDQVVASIQATPITFLNLGFPDFLTRQEIRSLGRKIDEQLTGRTSYEQRCIYESLF
jgi:hypothetical protein